MLTAPDPPHRAYAAETFDSRRWDAFVPREGDVVVSTPPKSGTTWMQTIVAFLLSGDLGINPEIGKNSPWIDMRVHDLDEMMGRLAAQTGRRHVKTHTPLDGIPVWRELRYITVFRHPIDVHFSFRKHEQNLGHELFRDLYPEDPSESFRIFVEGEHAAGASLHSIATHYLTTLEREPSENLLRLHYADMARDLAGAVDTVARHIGAAHSPEFIARVVEAVTFDNMKKEAERFSPTPGKNILKSQVNFFDSGTSNKWQGILSEKDLAAYDARMDGLVGTDARAWLEWGSVR